MSDKPVIGFIGVGPMGHGMAKNILEGGYTLYIKGNRNRAPVEDLLGLGAIEAATPREMAEKCDIIHTCLSNSPQVEAIIRGPDGVIASGRKGLIVVECTTADPTSTMALAADLEAAGMALADAPLGRTPKEAEAGTLDAMIGANEAAYEKIRPVVECWAGAITHIGPTGSGHKMKLLMNFLGMSYASLYAEMLTLGAKVGIAPQTVQKVLGPSRLGCGFFDTFTQYAVGRDENAHIFSIANANKDIGYVNAMAMNAGVTNVMASAAKQYFTHAVATGQGEKYVPMMSDIVAELNGMDLGEEVKKGESGTSS